MKKTASILVITAIMSNLTAWGQAETSDVTLLPTSYVTSVKAEQANHTVYTVEGDEIQRFAGLSVGDALEWITGLEIRQRGVADVQSDVSLRGSTFDQVLILVNGVPYSDPQTGHHSMNIPIPMAAVARIEVMSSGGSYRYGPFAFAGVINIITQSGKDGYAEAGIGQYGYQRGSAGVYLGSYQGIHTRADMQYIAADGQISNRDFTQTHLFVRSTGETSIGHVDLQLGWLRKAFGAANFYTWAFPDQYEAIDGYSASFNWSRAGFSSQSFVRQHRDHFELFREDPGFYEYMGSGIFMNTVDSSFAPSWYSEHNNHRSRTAGTEFAWEHLWGRPWAWSIKTGADMRYDEILSNNLGIDMGVEIPAPDGRAVYTKFDHRQNAGAFIQYEMRPIENLRVNLSGRGNWNSRVSEEIQWLPGVDVGWHLDEGLLKRFYASYNQSFRLPTFTDLYYSLGGAQGSANLLPEYAHNYELGAEFSNTHSRHQISLYERRGQNLIDWIYRDVNGSQVLEADNITSVAISGVEFESAFSLEQATFRLAGAMAMHDASDIDGQSIYALDYLANRLQASILTQGSPLKLGLTWSRQDRAGSYANTSGETVEYKPFHTIDVRAQYELTDMTIYVDIRNAMDAVIIDRGNVPLPGRWITGGVKFNWE